MAYLQLKTVEVSAGIDSIRDHVEWTRLSEALFWLQCDLALVDEMYLYDIHMHWSWIRRVIQHRPSAQRP